nr:ribonuclease H-like domain-containing protein [Tanacetum cinerariifolium]
LFNGRTPAIGFLKPFGCHVMILITLEHLGKFEAKGDEGFFIGYFMSSKAFRVFNKRTKRVEENLHVDFLENKAIEKGACLNWVFNKRTKRVEENLHIEFSENKAIEKGADLNWLFDIDSLTKSMNYVPVVDAGTNSTNFSGTKDAAGQEVKKDVSTLRYIALTNWAHDAFLESSSSKSQDDCNIDVPESRMKGFAMWDWGHRITWGVGRVNGTVQVRGSVRERAVGEMGIFARNSGHRITWGVGRVNGTVQVRGSVRERAVGEMGVLAGNSVGG